jgi:hypothetical protein
VISRTGLRPCAWPAHHSRRVWPLLILALAGLGGCAGSTQLATLPTDWPARVELDSTPFHPQTEHQCGPAALATVLGAAGRNVEPAQLTPEVYLPGRAGSLQPELVAAARARGVMPYELGPGLDDVLAEAATGRPVLVLQRLGAGRWPNWHYAVVIGYDRPRNRVLLRSGTDARLEQRAAVFEATWNRGGRWAIVLLEPGQLPARPDLARYMRAAAPLESHVGTAADAAYRAALQQWPDAPLPALGLGNLAAARGDWRQAEYWYRSALTADPSTAAAVNNRAEALQRLGCNVAARRAMTEGIAHVAPGDPLRPALESTARTLVSPTGAAEPAVCSEFTVR